MKFKTSIGLATGVIVLAAVSTIVQAANKTWSNGAGGFVWDTATTANWTGSTWTAGDEAIFGATGVGAVNVVGGGITATSLTFNTAGYTIGGGTITLDTSSITQIIANQSVTINSALNKTGVGGGSGNYFNATAAASQTLTLNGNLDATALSDMFFQGAGAVAINGSIGSNYRHFQLNSGATTVTFAAANSFTGLIQLHAGGGAKTLNFSNVNQLGNPSSTGQYIAIQGSSMLRYTGTTAQIAAARDLYWNSGSATIDITSATGDLKFNITGGDLLSGGGTFTKTGDGTLTLANSGNFNPNMGKPVALNNGTLAVQATDNVAGSGTNYVLFSSTVTGASGTQIKVLAGTGIVGNASFTANWTNNLADMDIAAGGMFGLRGNHITIDALTGGGDLFHGFNSGAGAGTRNVTLGVDNGSGTFSGIIHGNVTSPTTDTLENGVLAVVKEGTGTQTLSGNNTYIGTTAVNNGTLLVNGTHIGGGTYTVDSDATLGGNGTISAPVTLSGTIAPGNSVGLFTTGSETWNSGATFHLEINDASGTAGSNPGWDLLTITGAGASLTLNSGITIDLDSLTLANVAGDIANFDKYQSYDWLFVDADAAISTFNGSFFTVDDIDFLNDITGFVQDGMFSVVRGETVGGDNTQLYLHYQAAIAPEPSTWKMALVGVLALGLFAWRQRPRRRN